MAYPFNYSTLHPRKPRVSPIAGSKRSKSLSAIPPPPSASISKQGYSTMSAISQNALRAALGSKKRSATEDEYFDDEEDDSGSTLAYIPAPGSPTNVVQPREVDVEDDPLDAFMAGIEREVRRSVASPPAQPRVVRNDLEEEDDEESYYRFMQENPSAGTLPAAEEDGHPEVEYDEDGNPIAPERRRHVEPLPAFDHSTVEYAPFRRSFYMEHEEIAKLQWPQVNELRAKLELSVTGRTPPKPICAFAHFNFDERLVRAIARAGYVRPTAVQAQAVPAGLLGRDVLAVAQTGSGKTAAFLWPMVVHIADQPPVVAGDGPIGLVLAPTRELALQIYNEARRWARVYEQRVICCYGGSSRWAQSAALREGAEIVVATPGRIIDQVKAGATNLRRVTYLVLDEADRMFELGFEPQVRSVVHHTRPDRQTLLFSATFKRKIERLAKDVLDDPVRIAHGMRGQANEDVRQHAMVLPSQEAKRAWLYAHMVGFLAAGAVLIFVTRKADAEQVAADLRAKLFDCLLLHGDMEQADRNRVITAFKRNECALMVATDVAARGLDIAHIRTVVNFDVARDIDTHTHRIGRTGRAGAQGTSFTLLVDKDKEFAGHIVRNMEAAKQTVGQDVLDLALKSSWFKKARYKKKDGPNVGGLGLGFVEKARTEPERTKATTTTPTTTTAADAGGAGSRLTAMKAAFKAQYMTQFRSATPTTPTTHAFSAPPTPSGTRTVSTTTSAIPVRKKTRWQ